MPAQAREVNSVKPAFPFHNSRFSHKKTAYAAVINLPLGPVRSGRVCL
ncbi:hypothetical protein BN132_80 [Cronobacter turicensis 564]|nr:hypothetical protein BN132_80 [Cronobacter turicensis 564]